MNPASLSTMLDKAAVPFWVVWSVAMLIGLITGDLRLWLILGAVVGVVVGVVMRSAAMRNKQRAF